MVQRKVPSNLCIPKTDHLKSENRTAKLRPGSPRFQDGKNKGTEENQKMKRSKSMKRSTIESGLRTPKIIKDVPQPGKPPTDEKQKQTPNYMKSTSSFKARKEESQVNSQASVKRTKKSFENTISSSNSARMPAKTLTRTSSLKRVTTIRTSSSKPIIAADQNCLQVVLCEDSKSQRATCSSTLKDSKFPNYLKLSHGATESEGTSLMKVCPYTYCSLNGHKHAALPPLKSFISAKRRMVKTQKNLKLGCLSPRKTKPSGDLERNISGEMVVDEKAATQEPLVQENHMDFHIEVYVEKKGDDSKSDFGRNEDEDGDGDELSNEAPNSENDFENNLDNSCDVTRTDFEFLPQGEQIEEEAEEVNSVKSNREGETPEIVSNQSEMGINGTNSETCDIEWEEGQHHTEEKDGYDSEKSSRINKPIFSSEKIFFDEILVDGSEEVCVQSGDEGTEFINNQADEVSNECVVDKEPSALLTNEQQYSAEMQQEKIHEDYKSIENNTQASENEISHAEILVEDFLTDTKDTTTNQSQQEMDEKNIVSESLKCLYSIESEDQTHLELNKVIIANEIVSDIDAIEMVYLDNPDDKKSSSADKDETQKQAKTAYTRGRGRSYEDLQSNTINLQINKREKSEEDLKREREFNPCEPNYLPVTPDPEGEKVDLKHQDLDDRKNAEEWMIDYALQQTLSKLGHARKKKVALLVEAFEKVAPSHYDTSTAFASIVHIQACS